MREDFSQLHFNCLFLFSGGSENCFASSFFVPAHIVCKKMAKGEKSARRAPPLCNHQDFRFVLGEAAEKCTWGRVSLRDDDDDENSVFYWGVHGSIQPQIACYSRAHLIVLRADEAIFRLHRSRHRSATERVGLGWAKCLCRRKNCFKKPSTSYDERRWKCVCGRWENPLRLWDESQLSARWV